MNTQFYGRCHPDNIWALMGLEKCLEKKIDYLVKEKSMQDPIIVTTRNELVEIQNKAKLLKDASDVEIKVACMCATKMAAMK